MAKEPPDGISTTVSARRVWIDGTVSELADPLTCNVIGEFDRYLGNGRGHWFHRRHASELQGPIAYFCAEYGIHESLGIYSGGLGVLAGDHVKTASDMALPLVGALI